MGKNRLDKFLASTGIGTRTEVKKFIKNGRVKVNEVIASEPAMKVDSDNDSISFDGVNLVYEEYRYYMFNKPAGCVSATKDKLSDTVLAYLETEITDDLFPVGRLDKDTEGFLLITNDGKLAHELLSPRKHVDKTYEAKVTGPLTDEQIKKFCEGLDIGDDKKTLPASIEKMDDEAIPDDETWYRVTIHEGRYHQIKRMFEALNQSVTYLRRVSMGKVCLDSNLELGAYRRLTDEELELLRNR